MGPIRLCAYPKNSSCPAKRLNFGKWATHWSSHPLRPPKPLWPNCSAAGPTLRTGSPTWTMACCRWMTSTWGQHDPRHTPLAAGYQRAVQVIRRPHAPLTQRLRALSEQHPKALVTSVVVQCELMLGAQRVGSTRLADRIAELTQLIPALPLDADVVPAYMPGCAPCWNVQAPRLAPMTC